LKNNKSISTVGIYLRPLRAIINEAIEEGKISRENHYPFGKRKYQIPASRNIKKALTKEEIKLIMSYNTSEGTWQQKAKDFFILSYLCNGINMKDIVLLKNKNIDGDFIKSTRAKTKYTNRIGSRQISVYISREAKRIIERWRTKDLTGDAYLFPILENPATPEKELKTVKQFTKMVNFYLREIASMVGITKPVTLIMQGIALQRFFEGMELRSNLLANHWVIQC
jgi:integrase